MRGGTRLSSKQVESWECDSGDCLLPCLLRERQSVLPLLSHLPPGNGERVDGGGLPRAVGASPASSPRGSEWLLSLGGGRVLAAAGVVTLLKVPVA